MKVAVRLPIALLVPICLVLFVVVPTRASVEGHFDRALSVNEAVQLEVETGSGSISVRAGGNAKVEIHGTIRANSGWHANDSDAAEKVRQIESNPPIRQDGNHIVIGRVEDRELLHNISISYEIVVPAETDLRSETGSGSQTIQGITGPVQTGSGSGSLHVSQIGKEVRAHTGSGSIELETIHSSVRATTGSGSIRAIGISGGLVASTGSGSVRLEQASAGDVEVETGSGGIEMSGVKGSVRARTGSGSISAQGEPAGRWRLHTGSGTVTVRLPEKAAFDLDAQASSGNIETTHSITVVGTLGRHELRGKANGGGPLLELSTSSGNIHID